MLSSDRITAKREDLLATVAERCQSIICSVPARWCPVFCYVRFL